MEKLLKEYLSCTLNWGDEEIATLYTKGENGELTLKPEAIDVLKKADAERMKTVKESATPDPEKLKQERDDQYKRGQKETATKAEKEFKETFEIESDKIGIELYKEAKEKVPKASPDIEELKKAHNQKEVDMQKKHDETVKTFEDKLKGIENEREKAGRHAVVIEKAGRKLTEMKAVMENIPAKIINGFHSDLKAVDYSIDGETIIPLNEKGEVLKDEHEKIISIDTFIETAARNWLTFQQDGKASAGNTNTDPPSGTSPGTITSEEYLKKSQEVKTKEEREALAKLEVKD